MIARILLPDAPQFSVPVFVDSLRDNFVGTAIVSEARKVEGKILVDIDSVTLQIGMSSKPVAWHEDQVIRFSEHWSPDVAAIRAHSAQLMFKASGGGDPVKDAQVTTVAVLTALSQCPAAICVFWEPALQCIPAVAFLAASSDRNDWPSLWVSIACQDKWQGAVGCTRGLSSFGQREIETNNATESSEELFARIYGLVDYLLQNGPIIKNGETFGQTANEKITVRFSENSKFGSSRSVMDLDYSAARIIQPVKESPVPQKMSAPVFTGSPKRKSFKPIAIAGSIVIGLLAIGIWGLFALIGLFGSSGDTPPVDIARLVNVVKSHGDAESRLAAAEQLVGSGDQLFFGNDSVGNKLARMGGNAFTSALFDQANGNKELDEIADHRIETYCDHQSHKAVVLFDVPGYGQASTSARHKIDKMAWESAKREAGVLNMTFVAVSVRDGEEGFSVQAGAVGRAEDTPDISGKDRNVLLAVFKGKLPSGGETIASTQSANRSGTNSGRPDANNRFGANGRTGANGRIGSGRRSNPDGNPFETANPNTKENQRDKATSNARRRRNANRHPDALTYKFEKGERISYRGTLKSETAAGELESSISFSVRPGEFDTHTFSGTVSTNLTSRDKTDFRMLGTSFFEGERTVGSNGKLDRYSGKGFIPLVSMPVGLSTLIEFPDEAKNDWVFERAVLIRTVAEPLSMDPDRVVETQIQYDSYESPEMKRAAFGRPRDGFASDPAGIINRHREHELHACKGKEISYFKIKNEDGDLITIECEYSLFGDEGENSNHEVNALGTYVFNKKLGHVVSVELKGDVIHTNPQGELEAPFLLELKHWTEEDKKQLSDRVRERKKERQKRDEKRASEKLAKEAAEIEKWKFENVLAALASDDKKLVRDMINELAHGKRFQPPNAELGRAVINLLHDNPSGATVYSNVVEKWVTEDLHEELLEVMPDIVEPISFNTAATMLRKAEAKGLPKVLISCLESENLRTWANMSLNRYDKAIETQFNDLLKESDDREALKAALSWMNSNGSRRSIAAIRRLGKRSKDRTIVSRCESTIRFIELRNRR